MTITDIAILSLAGLLPPKAPPRSPLGHRSFCIVEYLAGQKFALVIPSAF
jgi:hypothetical protein